MKVLHINCNYFGNNPVHRNMINTMNKIKKIDNYVFSAVTRDVFDGITDKIIASKCISSYDRLFFKNKSKKIRQALLKQFDVNSFDLIHAYTVFTDGNVAYELNKKYGIPYVVAVRNTDINTFLKYMPHLRKKGIEILKNASKIFFLSNAYKEKMINKYIPTNLIESILNKSYIIPNGINDFWRKNLYCDKKNNEVKEKQIKDKHLKIVFAGNIDKNKNLAATCKTIELLEHDGWKVDYLVAGKIKNEKIFSEIKNRIDYRGTLNEEELIKLYREADIFVMPSFTETFGISYVEAMSQGLPVIYTKGEGFDTQFTEGEVGYAVNPNDPNDIKEKIMKILDNYSHNVSGISKKVLKFSWMEICKKYVDIYNVVIGADNEKN